MRPAPVPLPGPLHRPAPLVAGAAFTVFAHYPTDTVVGFCVAVAIGLGSALVIEWIADRRAHRRRPVRVEPAPPTPA